MKSLSWYHGVKYCPLAKSYQYAATRNAAASCCKYEFLSGKSKLWKQRLKRFFQPLDSLIEGSLSFVLSEKGILPSFLVAAICSKFSHLLLQTAVEARFSHGIPYDLGISTLGCRTVTWQSLINLLQPKVLQQVAANMSKDGEKQNYNRKSSNLRSNCKKSQSW